MATKFKNGIDLGSQKITSVADPATTTDAATKNYVDTQNALNAKLASANTLTDQNSFTPSSTSYVPITINQVSSGTGNLQEWRYWTGSANAIASNVTKDGAFFINNANTALTNTVTVGSGSISNVALAVKRTVALDSGNSALTPLVVFGRTSQTANLQEWRNPNNTALASISPAGLLTSVGANMSSTKITSIADATASGDAVHAGMAGNTITASNQAVDATTLGNNRSGLYVVPQGGSYTGTTSTLTSGNVYAVKIVATRTITITGYSMNLVSVLGASGSGTVRCVIYNNAGSAIVTNGTGNTISISNGQATGVRTATFPGNVSLVAGTGYWVSVFTIISAGSGATAYSAYTPPNLFGSTITTADGWVLTGQFSTPSSITAGSAYTFNSTVGGIPLVALTI